jgi:hypothetical protein
VLSIYIVATIIGGLLLTISLIGGGHHGAADGDHPGDLSHDASAIDSEHGDIDTNAPHGLYDLFHGALPGLLSTRLWIHLLAFGGLTGVLLRLIAHLGEPETALISGAIGIASGVYARTLFSKAAAMGSGGTITHKQLTGHLGTVLVPFSQATTGKVRVQVKDETVDLLATSEEGQEFALRQQVLILGFRDGRALVAHTEAEKE